jgi:hypothetical protein
MGPTGVVAERLEQKPTLTGFYGRLARAHIDADWLLRPTGKNLPSAVLSSAEGNGEEGEDCLPAAARSGFALTAPHFLLLRQKKVSKEKATPGYAVGCADCPALLVEPGGWLNSPLRGSNTASRNPPARLCCSALHMGPKGVAADKFAQKNTDFYGRLAKTPIFTVDRKSETLFPQPSVASSCAAGNGIKGEDCLRPAGPSSAAPRCARAAQSTRRSRAPQRARLFFGYFLLARQKKVRPPVSGGNQRIRKPGPRARRGTRRLRKAHPPVSCRKQRIISQTRPHRIPQEKC